MGFTFAFISHLSSLYQLQAIINNAAVAQLEKLTPTKEGFEGQFGANHLGHFLFTSLLFPSILAARDENWKPRIVSLTSLAATFPGGEPRFDDLHYKLRPEEYNKYRAYSHAKTANTLFALELAKRYESAGILAFAVHPGGKLVSYRLLGCC